MTPVPDKKGSTLVSLVEEMARGPRTRIWTDGATHNAPGFDGKYRWSEVIHRNEWITEEGVHTNTVEGANSMLKKRLVCEGGSLGRSESSRKARLRAITEKCNGSLRVPEQSPLVRVLLDVALFCAEIVLCS